MAYLGKYETRTANFKVYTSSTATATHTLSWTPTSKQSLRITINGVVQQDDAFELVGTTVTLDDPIVATDVLEIVGVNELGGQALVPADGSIQAGKLSSNAVTTAKIEDNAVTLAKMAGGTDGNLITYDASGDPAYVATGTATHLLTSNGAGAAPTFQAPPAGGLSRMDTWMMDTDMTITSNTITLIDDFTHSSDSAYDNYMIKNVGAAFDAPSSGIFTFPETGTWQASLTTYLYAYNGYYTQLRIWVDVTADNGSNWYTNAIASNELANTSYGGSRVTSAPLNISNLSNDKVRFQVRRHYADAGYIDIFAPGNTLSTGDAAIGTFVTFTKLA